MEWHYPILSRQFVYCVLCRIVNKAVFASCVVFLWSYHKYEYLAAWVHDSEREPSNHRCWHSLVNRYDYSSTSMHWIERQCWTCVGYSVPFAACVLLHARIFENSWCVKSAFRSLCSQMVCCSHTLCLGYMHPEVPPQKERELMVEPALGVLIVSLKHVEMVVAGAWTPESPRQPWKKIPQGASYSFYDLHLQACGRLGELSSKWRRFLRLVVWLVGRLISQ